jgi:phospholipid transport system substrate-binding protein
MIYKKPKGNRAMNKLPTVVFRVMLILSGFIFSSSALSSSENEFQGAQKIVNLGSIGIKQSLISKNINLKNNPGAVFDEVASFFEPNLDFEKIGIVTLGDAWKSATVEQKAKFKIAFQGLFVRAYSRAILNKSQADFSIIDTQKNKACVKVRLEVSGTKSPAKEVVDYYLSQQGDDWKVYNVKVNGISLLKAFQFTFKNMMLKTDLDQLITNLEMNNLSE